jgi:hypothetical protein
MSSKKKDGLGVRRENGQKIKVMEGKDVKSKEMLIGFHI